jgi:hypothetical protein
MGRLTNGKLVSIWKKMAKGYLNVLSPGETEDSHKNPQDSWKHGRESKQVALPLLKVLGTS